MTWYAHHLFAESTPAVIEALAAAFPGRVYQVDDLAAYRRTRREVFEVEITPDGGREIEREVVEGPQVPAAGIVVVRELAHPDGAAAGWFGADAVSWLDVAGPVDDIVTPADVFTGDQEWLRDPTVAPPLPLLGWLRALAHTSSSVVSLVCVYMWGGDIEYELGWVFDGAWGDHRVYLRDGDGVRAWNGTRSRWIVDGDVLTLALVHHGLLLRDGYFALHTRSFPWERHRIR